MTVTMTDGQHDTASKGRSGKNDADEAFHD
jgi:hypothetical protein